MSSPPGFRLWWTDLVVIAAAVAAATALMPHSILAATLVLTVVSHFFLFCNVFRVPTRLELVWAVVFVGNVAVSSLLDALQWPRYLWIQLPVTLVTLLATMRHELYRGIFWRRLNPGLRWPVGAEEDAPGTQ